MRRASLTLIGILALLLAVPRVEAQPRRAPSLESVLARAGEYVVSYGLTLTSVLAEERYTQTLVWRHGKNDTSVMQERVLRSEIAFLRLVDSTEWLAFRNVLAVDGVAIPESDGRLERLFQRPPRSNRQTWNSGWSRRASGAHT